MKEAYDENDGNGAKILLNLADFENTIDKLRKFWRKYLNEILRDIQPTTNLNEMMILTDQMSIDYFQKLTKLLNDTPEIELNSFLWSYLAIELQKLYDNEVQMESTRTRTKQHSIKCIGKIMESMPMATTYAIFKTYFPIDHKPQVELIIENIRLAFKNSIKHYNWIDSQTKYTILEKINLMKIFVGAPEWIGEADKLDQFYAGLKMNEKSHLENIINCYQWEISRQLKTLHLVGVMEWPVSPAEVGAYYLPDYNVICLY